MDEVIIEKQEYLLFDKYKLNTNRNITRYEMCIRDRWVIMSLRIRIKMRELLKRFPFFIPD